MDAHDVARWTHVLYAEHAHLESRQVARLGQLYGALCAAALLVASSGGAKETEKEEKARAAKARLVETKLVQYFDDHEALSIESMENGQSLTRSLTEAIERDVAALVKCFRDNGKEAMTWTSVACFMGSRVLVSTRERGANMSRGVAMRTLVHLVNATSPEQLEWNEVSEFILDAGQFGSCIEAFDESTLVHYSIK
ncbi:hypothetical protein PsorP6_012741 [Peronosclerospora sorghi]|uniref:Uncharacterized protein n=1 Tax=Peronosclerospora sorghi TaxID=230839 RepID=A0ACC0WIL2_9STRA|nr:hypothetical protein PsorP6_012741 [Peronosclerospora sorghi]